MPRLSTTLSTTVTGGSAPYNYGGAIFNQGALAIKNSTIVQNLARRYGGGIWTLTAPVLHKTTVAGNSPDDVYVK